MNYYMLSQKDQPKPSWAFHEPAKPSPKRRGNLQLPPVMNQMFGALMKGGAIMKAQYQPLCCKACGRYDDDAVFDIGFTDPVTIQIKSDFNYTQDRVLAVSEKFVEVLRKSKVMGYETKPLGTSGWHALRVTERVDCDDNVKKLLGPFCSSCKRPDRGLGVFRAVSQVSLPRSSNTLFTTKKCWPGLFWTREVFMTEDVVEALKAGGVKGGWCNRLWTDEEVRYVDEQMKLGKKWKLPNFGVTL
jgi:hypothetical protein